MELNSARKIRSRAKEVGTGRPRRRPYLSSRRDFGTAWRRSLRDARFLQSELLDEDFAFAASDFADGPSFEPRCFDGAQDGGSILGGSEYDHADAHVEDLVHLISGDRAFRADQREDRKDRPGAFADDDIASGRQDARNVVHESATGDVGEAFYDECLAGSIEFLEQLLHDGAVADVNFEQFGAE